MNIPAAQLQRICRNGERDTVRRKPVEAGRATLQPSLMTKHSPFCYMRSGPRFLNHLAKARALGAKKLGLHRATESAPASCHKRCMSSVGAGGFCSTASLVYQHTGLRQNRSPVRTGDQLEVKPLMLSRLCLCPPPLYSVNYLILFIFLIR